jgi:hypothetical protein
MRVVRKIVGAEKKVAYIGRCLYRIFTVNNFFPASQRKCEPQLSKSAKMRIAAKKSNRFVLIWKLLTV